MDYTVLLTREEDGGFSVTVPDLPDVFAQGETEAEALENAKALIELSLKALREEGMDVPAPRSSAAVCSI